MNKTPTKAPKKVANARKREWLDDVVDLSEDASDGLSWLSTTDSYKERMSSNLDYKGEWD